MKYIWAEDIFLYSEPLSIVKTKNAVDLVHSLTSWFLGGPCRTPIMVEINFFIVEVRARNISAFYVHFIQKFLPLRVVLESGLATTKV